MTEREITSREQWLTDAIATTRAFLARERAENAYDMRYAAPDSVDVTIAIDSESRLGYADATLAALEAELASTRSTTST